MALQFYQTGPVTPHIYQSFGGSKDDFNHYSTTYNVHYGKHWVNREMFRKPKPGNNAMWSKRCHLAFHNELDRHDNPFLRYNLRDNYVSVTKKDYKSPKIKYRDIPATEINKLIVPQGYDFHTELTIPKHQHNPNDWTTMYSTDYNNKPPRSIDFHRDPIGKNELSGCTLNNPIINTLSFLPHSTYKNDWPRQETSRPTGKTIYTTDYRSHVLPDGSEPLPEITPGSDRSSGFVKGNKERPEFVPSSQENQSKRSYLPEELEKLKKTDPAEYLNAIYPQSHPSTTIGTYTDPGSQTPKIEEILNRVKVGDKEMTGSVANQINYTQTKDDPARFITHNMTKYYNNQLLGPERNGHVSFDVHNLLPDGFVKNNGVINLENGKPLFGECEEMDHYQLRSFNKRDYIAR